MGSGTSVNKGPSLHSAASSGVAATVGGAPESSETALAEAIERERRLAEPGGPDLIRWRALRLNRGTRESSDHEKIVSLDQWNGCVVYRYVTMQRRGEIRIYREW